MLGWLTLHLYSSFGLIIIDSRSEVFYLGPYGEVVLRDFTIYFAFPQWLWTHIFCYVCKRISCFSNWTKWMSDRSLLHTNKKPSILLHMIANEELDMVTYWEVWVWTLWVITRNTDHSMSKHTRKVLCSRYGTGLQEELEEAISIPRDPQQHKE